MAQESMKLGALASVCSLEPSPAPSSMTQRVLERLDAELSNTDVFQALNDEDEVPPAVASATAAAVRNAVHLATPLKPANFPVRMTFVQRT